MKIKLYEEFTENIKYLHLQRCQKGSVDDIWDLREFNGQHGKGIYSFLRGDKEMEDYYCRNGEKVTTFKVDTKYVKDLSYKNWDYWETKEYIFNNTQYKAFIFNHTGHNIPSSKEVLITNPEIIILENNEYIKEYQMGGSLPIFNYTGVNYGNGKDGVAGTFGGKADPAFNKRTSMNTLDDNLVYSEHTGEYYSETDIRALLFKYDVWTKQNKEEAIEITDLSTKTLDYILRTMDSK